MGAVVDIVLPQHNGGAGYYVRGQRPLLCSFSQHVMQVAGERSGQVDRCLCGRIHGSSRKLPLINVWAAAPPEFGECRGESGSASIENISTRL